MTREQLRARPAEIRVLAGQTVDWLREARGWTVAIDAVEKDFWVTEVPRSLVGLYRNDSERRDGHSVLARPVFKGGTSLSKAYGYIARFSEDADVYVDIYAEVETETLLRKRQGASDDPLLICGKARADTIMKQLAERAARHVGIPAERGPEPMKGLKCEYRFTYPRAESTAVAAPINPSVKLELVRMGSPEPRASYEIQSLIAEYVLTRGVASVDDFEEVASFSIDVLGAERTLVDKLSLLHDRAITCEKGGWTDDPFANQTRHYYDVFKLLSERAVTGAIDSLVGGVAALADQVFAESRAARRPHLEPRPSGGFAMSPAFDSSTPAGRAARAGYAKEVPSLVYEAVPTFDEILERVQANAHRL